MRFSPKMMLVLIVCFAALQGCRKKTLHSVPVSPGGEDTVSVPIDPPKNDTVAYYSLSARHESIGGNIGGFYESLPPSYDSNTNVYPLIVFLHGGGELGDGNGQLSMVLKNAIPKMIGAKTFPLSFTVSNEQYSFLVISPQFKAWPKPADVEKLVDYSVEHYRVDTQRIYMVGLSMGGGATWEYDARYGKRLAAMVPISGASWADSATAKGIAATNTPTWAFHNKDDDAVTYESTTRYIDFIKFFNPSFPVRFTLWPNGGHDAWTKATDPEYREEGKNIYEWMLQYKR